MVTSGGITSRKAGLTLVGRNMSRIARGFLLGIIPVVGRHPSGVKTKTLEERPRVKDVFNQIELSSLEFAINLIESLLLNIGQGW